MPAQRKYGMDQDYYQWSPIVSRPVMKWPSNARVALAVIVNLEYWDWEVPADNPLPMGSYGGPGVIWSGNGRFPDLAGYGNHEYGNRVGFLRVFEVLDKYGIKPTVAMDKVVADNYDYLVKESEKRGAEFIAHGITQRQIIHSGMSEAQERAYIHDSITALAKATGKQPIGWAGPAFQGTQATPNLLAAEGIKYVCDWGNDELPYKMNVKQGEMYSISPSAYLDDNYIHNYGKRTINEVSLLWRDWFDGLYADGAERGRMMILNIHPWVMGQPWRIKHLDEVLGHCLSYGGVWKATGSEILDWYKGHAK